MYKLTSINKTYSTDNNQVIKDLSLNFDSTGLVFILGPSGCGKTTLVNLLGGLDKYDQGSLTFNDRELNAFTEDEISEYRKYDVGFIFQDYNLLEGLSVEKNVDVSLKLQNRSNLDKVHKYLELLELDELHNRKINQLSGGQQQRVAIARVIVKNPRVLLCDEPTGNLDGNTSITIMNTLKNFSKDKLVIVVSHDKELAKNYADRIIELKDGEVVNDIDNSSNVDLSKISYEKTFTNTSNSEEIVSAVSYYKNISSKVNVTIKPTNVSTVSGESSSSEADNTKFRGSYTSGKASWKYFLKMAFDNIWHRKARVISVFIIFGLAVSFFATILAMYTFDITDDYQKQMDNSESIVFEIGYGGYDPHGSATGMKDPNIPDEVFGGELYNLLAAKFGKSNILLQLPSEYLNVDDSKNSVLEASYYQISNNYNYSQFDFIGSPITNATDIIITDAIAYDLFGEVSDYNDYLDMTHTTSDNTYTVVGIISTNYKSNSDVMSLLNGDTTWLDTIYIRSYLTVFMSEDLKASSIGDSTNMYIMNDNQNATQAEYLTSDYFYLYEQWKGDFEFSTLFKIEARVNNFLGGPLYFAVVIVSIILSSIFVFVYINISIDYRKKEIGILKSLGSTNNQVMSIFTIQSVIMAIIGSVVSIFVGIFLMNIVFDLFFAYPDFDGSSGFSYSLVVYFGVLLFSIFIGLLSVLLPYIKFNKKQIIDIIKEV